MREERERKGEDVQQHSDGGELPVKVLVCTSGEIWVQQLAHGHFHIFPYALVQRRTFCLEEKDRNITEEE